MAVGRKTPGMATCTKVEKKVHETKFISIKTCIVTHKLYNYQFDYLRFDMLSTL